MEGERSSAKYSACAELLLDLPQSAGSQRYSAERPRIIPQGSGIGYKARQLAGVGWPRPKGVLEPGDRSRSHTRLPSASS